MEPASFVIGVAGLAALFETCLKGFELFEQGKDFGRTYTILLTRLDAQKLLFLIWGETVGLSIANDPKLRALAEDVRIAGFIQRQLECIRMIFEDADQLSRKYGVTKMKTKKYQDVVLESSPLPSKSPLPLRRYVHWFQKQSSFRLKAQWAIQDQTKFKTMLDDLSTILQQLRETTSAIVDIERQRDRFLEEIGNVDDFEELEIIEEALSEEDPALSNAASERRTALTEAAMTTLNGALRQHDNDDVVTHADSDSAAQASFDLDERPWNEHLGSYQSEQTFSLVTAYGHQNNLGAIQQKDFAQISVLEDTAAAFDSDGRRLLRSAVKSVKKQLRRFQAEASTTPFISLGLEGNRLDRLMGSIQGPPNTPYEGGVFRIAMRIPIDYPFAPVHCRFLTPIHHPNIDSEGNICIDFLNSPRVWNPVWTLELILTAICSLLGSPQYEDAIVPDVAHQWKFDRYNFEIQARLKTQRFATPVCTTGMGEVDWIIPGKPGNPAEEESTNLKWYLHQAVIWLTLLAMVPVVILALYVRNLKGQSEVLRA